MEIRVTLPSEIDAEVIPELDQNKKVIGFVLKPRFYNATESKTYMWVDTLDREGNFIEKYAIRISGNTGKSTKAGVQEQEEVVPSYYAGGPPVVDDPQHEEDEDELYDPPVEGQ